MTELECIHDWAARRVHGERWLECWICGDQVDA